MSAEVSFTGNESFPVGEELESLYLKLENENIPELQWKSPGRIEEESKAENPVATENAETQKPKPTKNDFDFSDDFGTIQQQQQQQKKQITPKSAKKKTANFADVLKRIGK